jgi:hypothetical protein
VRIKITPLRPIFDRYVRTRGLPEWFHQYTDEAFAGSHNAQKQEPSHRDISKRVDTIRSVPGEGYDPHHTHASSFSTTLFSSVGSSVVAPAGHPLSSLQGPPEVERTSRFTAPREGDLAGVDKFCFIQPKNRTRPIEWWKPSAGDFAEKSLRVTQLQVAESFPACVSRQVVAHRLVFSQSPLEAGIDAVCQWCAILFQTAVATTGMAVLKTNFDPGIGTDAAKVVADCIHNSRVKEIGTALLREPSDQQDRSIEDFTTMDSGRLSDDEIAKLQLKLARLIVAFVELLHLLIGRNRDMLLEVIQDRKKNENNGPLQVGGIVPVGRGFSRQTSTGQRSDGIRKAGSVGPYTTDPTVPLLATTQHRRNYTDISVKSEDARIRGLHQIPVGSEDNQSYQSVVTSTGVRTESAIAVQSELQRAFISLSKALYKNVHRILLDDTPRWLKQIGQDNYFSLGTYLQTKIPIAEELCFIGYDTVLQSDGGSNHPFTYVPSFHSEQGYDSPRGGGGSIGGGSQNGSVASKGSERYGFGQF